MPTIAIDPAKVNALVALLQSIFSDGVKAHLAGKAESDITNDVDNGLVSARKARHLCKSGAITATKKGRRWYFKRGDLAAYLTPEVSAAAIVSAAAPIDPVDQLAASLGLRIVDGGRKAAGK